MKIMFLMNYAGKGGTEKYVEMLARRLLAKGDQCLLCYNETGPLVQAMTGLGVVCLHTPMAGPMDFKAAKAVAKICREQGIDIIHTQFARENYIAIHGKRYGSGALVIHTAHINLANNIVWKFLNSVYMKQNQAVIAVCRSVKNHLINNRYPSHNITVIPNGIAYSDDSEKSSGGGEKIRGEFNIGKDTFVFITLTRFTEEKGIFFLLDSLEELKKQTDIPFQVIFAGDGPLLEDAKAYAKEMGVEKEAIFAGYRTDSTAILNGGQAFINSSSSEASSFAILEAMAQGLPVIATDVGGNPDIVAGENPRGILVPYGDKGKLAMAMKKIMTEVTLREDFGKQAQIAVKNIFNADKTFEQTYYIYEQALKTGSKGKGA